MKLKQLATVSGHAQKHFSSDPDRVRRQTWPFYPEGPLRESLRRSQHRKFGTALRGATLLRSLLGHDVCLAVMGHRTGLVKADKYFIRRVLQTSVGLVQFTRSLGCQLAELVAVVDMGESSVNQIGTHEYFPFTPRRSWRGPPWLAALDADAAVCVVFTDCCFLSHY